MSVSGNPHPDPNHIGAHSTQTDTDYPNWDALVEAEAKGYVVTQVFTDGTKTWTSSTWVADKADAKRESDRVRKPYTQGRVDLPEGVELLVVTKAPLWLRPAEQKKAAVVWLHDRLRRMMSKVDGYAHLTASDEEKWEVTFLLAELESKGYDGARHCQMSQRGYGPGPYYDTKGRVKE